MENYTWDLDDYEQSFFDGDFLQHISYKSTGESENIQKERIKRLYINGNTALFKAIYTLSTSNENYELLVYVDYDNYDQQWASYGITKENGFILFYTYGKERLFDLPQTPEEIRNIVNLVLKQYEYNLISEITRSQDGKETVLYRVSDSKKSWKKALHKIRESKRKAIIRKRDVARKTNALMRSTPLPYDLAYEIISKNSFGKLKSKNKLIENDIIYLRSI